MEYEWRPVIGYEGIYEVRPGVDGGMVRRVSPIKRSSVGRELKGIDPQGYARAILSKPGIKPIEKKLHEMILEAWVGPKPPKHEGLHKDDIRINNTVDNLYWGTRSQNMNDMVRNGRHGKFTKPGYADRAWETRRKNGPSKQMKMIEFNGRVQCMSEWAREIGISKECLAYRLEKWSLKDALTIPKRRY